jgi:HEAT repeat protein
MALVSLLPAHTGELADALKACLKRHSPLTSEVVHPLMDLASGGPPETRHLAIEVLGESLHRVPGIQEKLLELAHDPEVTVRAAAIHSLGLARDLSDYALNELFDLLDGEPLPVRQAVAVTLAKLSRSLPQLGWTERRLQALADRLYRLLREIPPRAAWEPDVDGQNEVFEALSWLSPRYRPDV